MFSEHLVDFEHIILDASVQVTALIVLGCVLASEPAISETREAMLRLKKVPESLLGRKPKDKEKENLANDNFDFAEFSEPEEEENVDNDAIPWLLKRCLNNLGINFQVCFVDNSYLPNRCGKS